MASLVSRTRKTELRKAHQNLNYQSSADKEYLYDKQIELQH